MDALRCTCSSGERGQTDLRMEAILPSRTPTTRPTCRSWRTTTGRPSEWPRPVSSPTVRRQFGAQVAELPRSDPQPSVVINVPVTCSIRDHDVMFTPVDQGEHGGAGGNRTPVHQPVDEPATTVPDFEAVAASPAGRLVASSGHQRLVFPWSQPSFRPSVVFPTVILRFCCRAAADRPRVAFLLTMTLHSPEIRRRERTASWQFLLVPRLASLSNSGRVLAPRY